MKIVYIIVFFSLINCSNSNHRKKSIRLSNNKQDTIQKFNNTKQNIKKRNKDKKEITSIKCNCKWKSKKLPNYTDLTFSNNGKKFNIDTLINWKDNSKRLKIKSILLIDFDTIPIELAMFSNVERIEIWGINYNNIIGLEIFPKLKILKTDMLWQFDLSNADKWLKNIEILHSNKTKFIGLRSFKKMPKIKELKLSFSGFDSFPNDFTSLKCLKYFQIGAHSFGVINLNTIDLSNMPCLKFVEFHSWRKNIIGIPNGIDKIEKVIVHHGNLTKKEKEILKKTSG